MVETRFIRTPGGSRIRVRVPTPPPEKKEDKPKQEDKPRPGSTRDNPITLKPGESFRGGKVVNEREYQAEQSRKLVQKQQDKSRAKVTRERVVRDPKTGKVILRQIFRGGRPGFETEVDVYVNGKKTRTVRGAPFAVTAEASKLAEEAQKGISSKSDIAKGKKAETVRANKQVRQIKNKRDAKRLAEFRKTGRFNGSLIEFAELTGSKVTEKTLKRSGLKDEDIPIISLKSSTNVKDFMNKLEKKGKNFKEIVADINLRKSATDAARINRILVRETAKMPPKPKQLAKEKKIKKEKTNVKTEDYSVLFKGQKVDININNKKPIQTTSGIEISTKKINEQIKRKKSDRNLVGYTATEIPTPKTLYEAIKWAYIDPIKKINQKYKIAQKQGKFGRAKQEEILLRESEYYTGKMPSIIKAQDLATNLLYATGGGVGTGLAFQKLTLAAPSFAKKIGSAGKVLYYGGIPFDIARLRGSPDKIVMSLSRDLAFGKGASVINIKPISPTKTDLSLQQKYFDRIYDKRPPTKSKLNEVLKKIKNPKERQQLIESLYRSTATYTNKVPVKEVKLREARIKQARESVGKGQVVTRIEAQTLTDEGIRWVKNVPVAKKEIFLRGNKIKAIVKGGVAKSIESTGYYRAKVKDGKITSIEKVRETVGKASFKRQLQTNNDIEKKVNDLLQQKKDILVESNKNIERISKVSKSTNAKEIKVRNALRNRQKRINSQLKVLDKELKGLNKKIVPVLRTKGKEVLSVGRLNEKISIGLKLTPSKAKIKEIVLRKTKRIKYPFSWNVAKEVKKIPTGKFRIGKKPKLKAKSQKVKKVKKKKLTPEQAKLEAIKEEKEIARLKELLENRYKTEKPKRKRLPSRKQTRKEERKRLIERIKSGEFKVKKTRDPSSRRTRKLEIRDALLKVKNNQKEFDRIEDALEKTRKMQVERDTPKRLKDEILDLRKRIRRRNIELVYNKKELKELDRFENTGTNQFSKNVLKAEIKRLQTNKDFYIKEIEDIIKTNPKLFKNKAVKKSLIKSYKRQVADEKIKQEIDKIQRSKEEAFAKSREAATQQTKRYREDTELARKEQRKKELEKDSAMSKIRESISKQSKKSREDMSLEKKEDVKKLKKLTYEAKLREARNKQAESIDRANAELRAQEKKISIPDKAKVKQAEFLEREYKAYNEKSFQDRVAGIKDSIKKVEKEAIQNTKSLENINKQGESVSNRALKSVLLDNKKDIPLKLNKLNQELYKYVKLNPKYNNKYINSEEYKKILEKLSKQGNYKDLESDISKINDAIKQKATIKSKAAKEVSIEKAVAEKERLEFLKRRKKIKKADPQDSVSKEGAFSEKSKVLTQVLNKGKTYQFIEQDISSGKSIGKIKLGKTKSPLISVKEFIKIQDINPKLKISLILGSNQSSRFLNKFNQGISQLGVQGLSQKQASKLIIDQVAKQKPGQNIGQIYRQLPKAAQRVKLNIQSIQKQLQKQKIVPKKEIKTVTKQIVLEKPVSARVFTTLPPGIPKRLKKELEEQVKKLQEQGKKKKDIRFAYSPTVAGIGEKASRTVGKFTGFGVRGSVITLKPVKVKQYKRKGLKKSRFVKKHRRRKPRTIKIKR